ncbi:myb-like protein D isoform X2 [Chrysoperla carnea]|uniref:myb-like protein D isoform X2 n=1 Tax=Chrysoperla carnea TaxID=189513 RepID=UPI001D064681|nr:myb-like protein D isoform X2 [Chrysoperla carnea]
MHSYGRSWSSEEYIGNGTDVLSAEEESPPIIHDNSMEVIQSHCTHNNYKMDLYTNGAMVICSPNDEEKYWTDSGMHSPDCCNTDISSDDLSLNKSTQRLCNNNNNNNSTNPFCISPTSTNNYHPQIYSNNITSTNYGTAHLDDNCNNTHYTNHLKNHHENNCNPLLNTFNNPNVILSTGQPSANTLSTTEQQNGPKSLQCPPTNGNAEPFVRVVKKRNTANKKERRRTQSINNAYADLRDCIPSVPADTKLSKIKTLRLATSYISYLKAVLDGDKPSNGFCAEIENLGGGHRHNSRNNNTTLSSGCYKEITGDITICTPESVREINRKSKSNNQEFQKDEVNKTSKGRTGWPEHVWALEFKQEQNL